MQSVHCWLSLCLLLQWARQSVGWIHYAPAGTNRWFWCDPDDIQDSNNRHYSPHGYHACLLRWTQFSTTTMYITPLWGYEAFTLNHLPSDLRHEKNPDAILTLKASNNVFHYYGNTQSEIVERGCTSGLPDFVRLMPNLKHIDISNISSAGIDNHNWNRSTLNLDEVWSHHTRLVTLDISSNRNKWELSRHAFIKLDMLTHLNLSGCCKPFADFNYFSGSLKNIESLDISRNSWQIVDLINYPYIDVLRLSHSSFKRLSLQNLPKLKDVKTVGSSFEIMALDGLEQITVLELIHSKAAKLEIRSCPHLVEVNFFNTSVGNLNLSSLTLKTLNLTDYYSGNIELIDVSNSKIDELVIRDMTSLKGVFFRGSSIKLFIMDNPNSNITVRFSHSEVHELHLSDLQNLTELHFDDSSVHELHIKGESTLEVFSLLPLEMKATALIMKQDESKEGNNASLRELIVSSPNLIRLDLSAFPIVVARLRSNDSIQTLDLFDAAENILTLSDDGVVTVNPPVKNVPWNLSGDELTNFFELKSLNMTHCCVSIPEDAQFFRNLLNLVSLDVSYNSWKNPDESALFSLENLAHLNMSNTGSRFQWSQFFIRLAHLETLNVNNQNPATIFQLGGRSFSSSKLRSLSVSGNKFSGFDKSGNPFGLKSPENLKELDMSGAEITGVEQTKVVSQPWAYTNLRSLNIFDSRGLLASLNETLLEGNAELEYLDMGSLHLSAPETRNQSNMFSSLSSLRQLMMSGAVIVGYFELTGSEKGQFANLELLDLSNTSITVLDLQNLTTLNTLDVRGSSIETMHVEGLESMDTLNLIEVKGEELKLDGWPGLVEINLSFSKWDKIELKNCTGLKHLDLSNVTLTNLDLSELQDFESLEWIDLSNSTIEALIVRKTPFIRNINFFGSHIGKLHLEDLDSMKTVDLSFVEADEVHLIGWSGLETLNLSHCFVEHLSMVDTPDLKVLDLSHTSQRLLDQFNRTQLDNLASLNLSSCGLLDVEGAIKVSQNWKILDLSHNYLNSLPHDFLPSSGASQLASLDVSHNFMKTIPYGIVYPMTYSGNSDWNLKMGNNLLNCSDCKNSWLTHGSNLEHVEDAICHNPSDLHGKAVADVEICENQ